MDPLKLFGFVLFGFYAVSAVWLFLNGLVQLHLLWHYKKYRIKNEAVQNGMLPLPKVTIQIPLYNERYVIARLLRSLVHLDYPKHLFEVQVLDDSTDDTIAIVDAEVAWLRKENVNIRVFRRSERTGYKAGALQAALPCSTGELIAIFDADFIPPPHFLKALVPHFSDRTVGLVQARWGHINREENSLTRLQTFLLDTHFSIEQMGRSHAGYFINFCGTAGIWRKACIEESGGWDGTVLSEDLDLSYRAQLRGWKLVYDPAIEVPAELPAAIDAFKVQQFRWTKGMAQVFRKNLQEIWKAPLPLAKKVHSIFHLLGSFVFVCVFINAILTVPLLLFRSLYPAFITLTEYSLFTSLNLVALTIFYYNGVRSRQASPKQFFAYFPLFLVLYMALCVQNTVAVLQGLAGRTSAFVRTPKFNMTAGSNTSYRNANFTWINGVEGFLFFYFLGGIGLSFFLNDYFMLLFFTMICYGLGFILYQSVLPKVAQHLAYLRTWMF
jgi:cellulose synthase/poly-beta-1,6-N-acetylglucosamine synthase-like glycosyltransferase